MNLFVASLNYDTTAESLEKLFTQYGKVSSTKIIWDKVTNQSKGYGFVEMENDDEGRAAIAALEGSEFEGRTLQVRESQPKPKSQGNDRGGRNDRGRNNDRGGYNNRNSRSNNYNNDDTPASIRKRPRRPRIKMDE